MNFNPARSAWNSFPDVAIQAEESAVKKHPDYLAAKSGDIVAAQRLALAFIGESQIQGIRASLGGAKPIVAAVQAIEEAGENVIPTAIGGLLAVRLGLLLDDDIVQINRVGRTGSGGFYRLAIQPLFDGSVSKGSDYLLVDDFIGQGGTLANLKGHIEAHGGRAVFAATLTGKPYSARLNLSNETLESLRNKHGTDLEKWWEIEFGYGFDRLTESEARYLLNSPDVDTIRNRIVEAKQAFKQ
ncbi:MAG: phosphoribosyltransferase [Hydrogenophilales bacterium]|nr:phosphoribosyltransferase [Hydrogenophilales bacterium]